MPSCNPFKLFPNQVEQASLWKYTSPGLDNIKLADLNVIIKHSTESDQPTEYASRIATRRFHIQPTTLPETLRKDMEAWPDLILELGNDRTYQITKASRGDDMDTGETLFITITTHPYGRTSL
ncbi:MAG: hypothetical protein [Namikivirus tsukuho]|uniref:Head-tail adaptor protein n=1 Tax=Bacteriophage sp. TaxID=38018 RepID=A0ABY5TRE0_9VIRU|nr:MAG: hypothetical protein [Bacteriophage sp.]